MRASKGFSLIELLLVLGVICMLMVASFIIYPQVKEKNEIAARGEGQRVPVAPAYTGGAWAAEFTARAQALTDHLQKLDDPLVAAFFRRELVGCVENFEMRQEAVQSLEKKGGVGITFDELRLQVERACVAKFTSSLVQQGQSAAVTPALRVAGEIGMADVDTAESRMKTGGWALSEEERRILGGAVASRNEAPNNGI